MKIIFFLAMLLIGEVGHLDSEEYQEICTQMKDVDVYNDDEDECIYIVDSKTHKVIFRFFTDEDEDEC